MKKWFICLPCGSMRRTLGDWFHFWLVIFLILLSILSGLFCMLQQPSTPSNFSVLSSLALCFFSLFFALYSCLLCFNRSDLAPFILIYASSFPYFFDFLSPILLLALLLLTTRLLMLQHLYTSPCSSSGSSISPRASNLLVTSTLYLLLISSLCSLRSLNPTLAFFVPSARANFSLIHCIRLFLLSL